MDGPVSVDLTKFVEFDIIHLSHEWDLNGRIDDGWRLIAIWIDRPSQNSDGSFTDEFVAVIGKESSEK